MRHATKKNVEMFGHATLALLAVAISGCIAPQTAPCNCPGTSANATAASSSTDTSSAKSSSSATSAPPPVKPSGALLSDGKSPAILNVNPGGSWFVFNDKTAKGSMTPPSTGEFGTAIVNGAIHSTGKGFSDWGGGIGFNFVGADSLTPLDVSGYTGISFKASGSGSMKFLIATVATMPEFGACTKCYDHFMTEINDLSPAGKTYTFKWSQLHISGWGVPKASWDPKTLIGLNFTSKHTAPWDFTIDDIQLTQ